MNSIASSNLQSATAAQPVKLMKVMANFCSGGTEGQVLNLVRSLDQSQFDLQFSCLRKNGELLDEFSGFRLQISEYRIKSLYKYHCFRQQLRFARQLRADGVQISHSYNFYANMFAIPAARLARIPVVIASIRDRGVYLTPVQQIAQKWVCSQADTILVNADSIRDWLGEQGYDGGKIVVIKNGIDMARFENLKSNPRIRQELGIPPEAPIIVMIARLNAQKGVEDFIKSAALVNRSHPQVRFLIVGTKLNSREGVISQDGQYIVELQQLAQELGVGNRVIFAGYRDDTDEILAESAISVLPSHSEGLSNTLLESMAAGIPTIATDVGGNPELVKDQVNGFLIPVQDPQRLAQASTILLDNPELAKDFGQQGKIMARQGFSLEKMARDTQALYRREVNHRHRGPTGNRTSLHDTPAADLSDRVQPHPQDGV